MGFFGRLFKRENDTPPESGPWIEVGPMGNRPYSEFFPPHALAVLRRLGRRGSLANVFVSEMDKSEWGKGQLEVRNGFLAQLFDHLVMYEPGGMEGLMVMTGEGIRPAKTVNLPFIQDQHNDATRIKRALETRNCRFLCATRLDGARTVAILLLE